MSFCPGTAGALIRAPRRARGAWAPVELREDLKLVFRIYRADEQGHLELDRG